MKPSNTNADKGQAPGLKTPSVQAWIGFDWGHSEHAFALRDRSDQVKEGKFPHSSEALHAWAAHLAKKYHGGPVHLAIEALPASVTNVLVQYPWLTIYPINCTTSARYRQAFTPSGASDDLPDARVLLELVSAHEAKLRPLEAQDEVTVRLKGLVGARRRTVDARTQVLNQITSLLREYFPQALSWLGNLGSAMAVDFLDRWPNLQSLQATETGIIKKFFLGHNLRRPELLKNRLKEIRHAVAVTDDASVVDVAVMTLAALLDQLRALRKHVALFDAEINKTFSKHPDAHLFKNLPGAGSAMAPRLCVAFGTVRSLYPDAASLQKFVGVAPVREKSGQSVWTHWRLLAPKFLRQTFVEWAGLSTMYCPWARAFYKKMREKGKSHNATLRALAFKWTRILWKCWINREPYDEERYVQQLTLRKSPYAVST